MVMPPSSNGSKFCLRAAGGFDGDEVGVSWPAHSATVDPSETCGDAACEKQIVNKKRQ
jgi:hypothetical protein